MKLIYNQQAKKLLSYMDNKEIIKNLNNKELQDILKKGFKDTERGVFLKYCSLKKHRFNWISVDKSKTENEWALNEVVIFQNSFKNKEDYLREIFLFFCLLIQKFKKDKINQEMIFSLSIQDKEYILPKIKDYELFIEDCISCAHFKIYGNRKGEEILSYEKNKINEYKTEALIIVVLSK